MGQMSILVLCSGEQSFYVLKTYHFSSNFSLTYRAEVTPWKLPNYIVSPLLFRVHAVQYAFIEITGSCLAEEDIFEVSGSKYTAWRQAHVCKCQVGSGHVSRERESLHLSSQGILKRGAPFGRNYPFQITHNKTFTTAYLRTGAKPPIAHMAR